MANIKHFDELQFSVTYSVDKHHVEFTVYDHEGTKDDGTPLFTKRDSDTHPDPVESIEEAEPYLHGEVRFDGCSNWYFDEQDRAMLHGCDKEDIVRFGLIMGECWELAKCLLPGWMN